MAPEDSADDSPRSADDRPPEEPPRSLDTLLDILANERRRYLLEFLQEQPAGVGSVDAAAEYAVTRARENRGADPDREGVRIELHQHHLPKLADAGLIEYDARSRTIRYCGSDRLEELYERIREFELE